MVEYIVATWLITCTPEMATYLHGVCVWMDPSERMSGTNFCFENRTDQRAIVLMSEGDKLYMGSGVERCQQPPVS